MWILKCYSLKPHPNPRSGKQIWALSPVFLAVDSQIKRLYSFKSQCHSIGFYLHWAVNTCSVTLFKFYVLAILSETTLIEKEVLTSLLLCRRGIPSYPLDFCWYLGEGGNPYYCWTCEWEFNLSAKSLLILAWLGGERSSCYGSTKLLLTLQGESALITTKQLWKSWQFTRPWNEPTPVGVRGEVHWMRAEFQTSLIVSTGTARQGTCYC